MLAQQLGHHLILVPQLGLQEGDPPLLGRLLPARLRSPLLEHHRPLLEQLLLPAVEHRWLKSVLLADLRDRHPLDQMLPQNGHLLSPTVTPSLSRHWKILRLVRLYRRNSDGPILQFRLKQDTGF